MALSAGNATIIANYLKLRAGASAGADDTATVAKFIRSHWGGTGTDAQVIALYGAAIGDVDLVGLAASIAHG